MHSGIRRWGSTAPLSTSQCCLLFSVLCVNACCSKALAHRDGISLTEPVQKWSSTQTEPGTRRKPVRTARGGITEEKAASVPTSTKWTTSALLPYCGLSLEYLLKRHLGLCVERRLTATNTKIVLYVWLDHRSERIFLGRTEHPLHIYSSCLLPENWTTEKITPVQTIHRPLCTCGKGYYSLL